MLVYIRNNEAYKVESLTSKKILNLRLQNLHSEKPLTIGSFVKTLKKNKKLKFNK